MWRATVKAVFFWIVFASSAFAETRIALVVGNSAYQNVSPLPNPVNDARLVANTLSSSGSGS
jgi:hypothetical protein